MRIAPAIGMMLHRLEPFAGHHHLHFFRLGLLSLVSGNLGAQFLPLGIDASVGVPQSGSLFFIQRFHATRPADCLHQGSHDLALAFRLEGRGQLRGDREARPTYDMARINKIIHFEGEFGAAFVFNRFGELEDANMVLADLAVHRPACFALIAIDG